MSAGALNIRPMADGEEGAVIALWQRAGLTRPWNDPANDLAFARGNAHSDILVGVADGTVVASAMVGHDGHRGVMYYVAVDPDLVLVVAERQLVERLAPPLLRDEAQRLVVHRAVKDLVAAGQLGQVARQVPVVREQRALGRARVVLDAALEHADDRALGRADRTVQQDDALLGTVPF